MERNKIDALIALLDDNNAEVIHAVNDNLLKEGLEIIPRLEKVWETTLNEKLQERLENVIQNIQFETTKNNLQLWSNSTSNSIFDGAFFLAQFQFPEIKLEKLLAELDIIKQDVLIDINNNITAIEKVKILNYVLFERCKFTRNASNAYSPQLSYINQVLETKKGNKISLAVVYLAVANKLKLPIYGVDLPGNIILAYKDEYRHYDAEDESDDIIFYINPNNKGAILGKREIELYIEQQGIKPNVSHFSTCTNNMIVLRLIQGLIQSYEKLGFNDTIERLKELEKLIQ
jgi:hypothetical protein